MTKAVALISGTLLITACAGACADPAPLRIAVVGSSGAPLGATLAVEDINASGGISGRLLEAGVVNEPAHVTPQQAIATADSLAARMDVLAVVGHGGSGTSIAASQVYNAHHVPQIAPNTSSPLYTDAGPYSFRLVASDKHQAEFIATRIAGMSRHARIAVLYINDDYGRALHRFLQTAFSAAGVLVVYEAPFISGGEFDRSLGDVVRSLKNATPDLLVWVGLPPELQRLRAPLRVALPALRVFGSDGVSFIGASADVTPFAGDWVVSYTDITASRPQLRSVAARFLPLSGRALTDGAALTYDAVGILAEVMRTGARTREAIQRVLAGWSASSHVYQGITGPIVFDEHGDARPSYVLLEITRDGMRLVKQ
jgi:branched-chain amino acid transport system substrate-binding protein